MAVADQKSAAAPAFEPGDIIAFSGWSNLSRFIRCVTFSQISHVAICAQFQGQTLLFESTTLADTPCEIRGECIKGVQAHAPATRVAAYMGAAWLYRLDPRWALEAPESLRLTRFLVNMIGVNYDDVGATVAGTQVIKRCCWPEDLSSVFCSELACAALATAFRDMNSPISSIQTPGGLVRRLVRKGIYKLQGKLK